MIENRKVRSKTRRFHELSQMLHRELAQRHALHRLATETQNADPKRVLTGVRITPHVATSDEGPQKVAGRALRESRDTADFRSTQPLIPARQQLENRQCPLNGRHLFTILITFHCLLSSCNGCRHRHSSPVLKKLFTMLNRPTWCKNSNTLAFSGAKPQTPVSMKRTREILRSRF